MKRDSSPNRKTASIIVVTLLSIFASQAILFIGYSISGTNIRGSEIALCIMAPLLIASAVSWYLFGLIRKLEKLEAQLRQSITKEKEEVYLATIQGAQHITNNLLNGLVLMDIEIRKHPEFDPKRKQLLDSLVADSKDLLKDLSSVEEVDPEKIRKSITPRAP